MDDLRNNGIGRAIGNAADRLRDRQWIVLAAALAMLGLYWAGGARAAPALLAMVIVIAVAAVAPRRTKRQDDARTTLRSSGRALDDLSPADLAAAVPDPLLLFDRRGTIVHANDSAAASFGGVAPGMDVQLKFRAP